MRVYAIATLLWAWALIATCSAQYRPWQVPKGASVRGETLISVVVPEFSIQALRLSEAFKHLSETFGLRFGVSITVANEFREPVINISAKSIALRELIDRFVRDTQFKECEWTLDGSQADSIRVFLGRDSGNNPLFARIPFWKAPTGYYPENVMRNLLHLIPELRELIYGQTRDRAGSSAPVHYGCELVYSVQNATVYEILTQLSRISGKSWIFVHVENDPSKSRILIF